MLEEIPNWSWIITGAIIFFGLIIFGILIFKGRKKHKAIKHYEEIRDKLSIREAEEETGVSEGEVNSYEGGIGIGNIVGGFIAILIGCSLLPIVSEQVSLATNASNITGAASTIVGIVPIFFALAIVMVVFSLVFGWYNSLKGWGLV